MSTTTSKHALSGADRVQIDLIRRHSVERRVAGMRSLTADAVEKSRRAIRNIHPDWTEREVLLEWAEVHYGRDLAKKLRHHMGEKRP